MLVNNKEKNEWSIEEALKKMLDDNAIKNKYIELKIKIIWEEIAGPLIKKHTTKTILKNKKFYIYIDSPIVKNELRMLRTQILENIQEKIGSAYLNEIIIR